MTERRTKLDPLDEVSRLLALQIRLSLESQTQAIVELHRVGLDNSRIAQLLGTTADTVKVTVRRSAKAPKPKAEARG
jgi:DNA-binding NarL/FixJ family response regulator